MIRVFIVDDHPIVHEGVAAALARTSDIRLVGSCESIEVALRDLPRVRPDVVLLDVRLQDTEATAAIGSLLTVQPGVRIVVFSAHDHDEYLFRAIRAGARGYVLKGTASAELARAVRRVHAGDSYVSPDLSSRLIEGLQSQGRGRRSLTPREMMVLKLMASGLSNRDIAAALSITERTVKFHVTAILNRLGADNRTQAVALASRRGLLPPDA
ncbi:MAG TPA: response regulator transcription factor [Vicinamibacterales bacterium]|nr:response regulator transcription factor [Vicinamibacterales bacterium]